MEANGDTGTETSRRQRSPQHPAFSLKEAIEKAGLLFEKEGSSLVAASVALGHWGYTAKSSSGLRCLATMADFGLVDTEGSGDSKRLGISNLGRLLVRHPDKESDEYLAALQKAALAPKVHQLIRENYETLPSDESLTWDLESIWGFKPSAIPFFVADLRETFDLAKLHGTDKIPEKQPKLDPPGIIPLESKSLGRPQAGMKQEVFTLAEGDAVLQWPSSLSQESYDDFKDWLDLIARKVARAVTTDDHEKPNDPESV